MIVDHARDSRYMFLYTTSLSCIWYIITFIYIWWHKLVLQKTGRSWAPAPTLCLMTCFYALAIQFSFRLNFFRIPCCITMINLKNLVPWFSIWIIQYMNSHDRDKTVVGHSYFSNWNSYTVSKASLYLTRMWNMITSPATPTVCLEQKSEKFQSRNVTLSMPSPSQK